MRGGRVIFGKWTARSEIASTRSTAFLRAAEKAIDGYTFVKPVNAKRLALSLSVIGAIAVPSATGSLIRFARHPLYPPIVQEEMSAADILCAAVGIVKDANEARCTEARRDPTKNVRPVYHYSTSLDSERAFPMARDAAIGLFVPAFLVLIFPRIVRLYLQWLTS